MESQMQHANGRNYDDDTHSTDEHHGEKKSVMNKVKAKAKKLKDTFTKHGHRGGEEEDDDEVEELVEEPEVHDAQIYESTASRSDVSRPDVNLGQPTNNLERPSVMEEDHRDRSIYDPSVKPFGKWDEENFGKNEASFSHEAHGTNVTDPTRNLQQGQEGNKEPSRVKIGQSTGVVEDPQPPSPNNRPRTVPISNSETKVTDPTHSGGEEIGVPPILRSFNKMSISDEQNPKSSDQEQEQKPYTGTHDQFQSESVPKSFDPNKPEELTRDTLPNTKPSNQSSYTEKISSSDEQKPKSSNQEQEQKPYTGTHDQFQSESVPKSFDPNKPEELTRDTLPNTKPSNQSSYTEKISSSDEQKPKSSNQEQEQKPYTGIHDQFQSESVPKSFDPSKPEELPRDTLPNTKPSNQSSNTEKISSDTSAITDKATASKDAIASKPGYVGQNESSTGPQETAAKSASPTEYASKIVATVVGAGSSVMSKMQGSTETGPKMQGSTEAGEKGPGQNESSTGPHETAAKSASPTEYASKIVATVAGAGNSVMSKIKGSTETGEKGPNKGVSVKEYLVEKFKPGDEDKALSEVITHAFREGKEEESEKKRGEDTAVGNVTESEEVARRLGGSDHSNEHSGGGGVENVREEKGVVDRLKGAVGSWFGQGNEAQKSQAATGTSYVTDQGLSNSASGEGEERRLQESSN